MSGCHGPSLFALNPFHPRNRCGPAEECRGNPPNTIATFHLG
jgi:hypothetical protein